jgi:putative spermidine/putrescine transport system permease protein
MNGRFAKPLILAAACLAYAFLLGPLAVVVAASFDGGTQPFFRFPPQELSWRWYLDLPTKYWLSLGFSAGLAFTAATIATIVGALAALGIARGTVGGKAFLEAYFRFPLQVPFVVTGIVFLQFYYAMADQLGLSLVGSFWGYVAAHAFFCIPYAVGAVGSVVTSDLERVENAARICGAGEWRLFRRITLPALKPGLFSGFFFAFITSFGDVPVSVFLTNGGVVPLPVEIFQTLQFDYDPTVLSISTLVVVISAAFVVAMQRFAGLDIVLPGTKR